MNRSAATDSSARNERSIGKGRRRRAAAEQRRIDQQRWGQLDEGKDEEGVDLVLTPASRRRNRRPSRRDLLRDGLEIAVDEIEGQRLCYDGSNELDVALALSLSLCEEATYVNSELNAASSIQDMSYESLVELENVKCVASPALVSALDRSVYSNPGGVATSCVICQNDYVCGDTIAHLPCKHDVHEACGSQWLLNYSKLCPVCKTDVTTDH